jgi:hypothetical protein
MSDERAGRRAAIACMRVCSAVADIDDEMLRTTLIREGVKVWLSGMSPKEVEQIASMEDSELREYVAQHAVDDINSRYDAHPDDPADEDGR